MIDADAFLIPLVEPVDAFVYLHLMMPSEVVEFGDISQLARSAVRFGSIPTQFAMEADFRHNLLCHLTYGQFLFPH